MTDEEGREEGRAPSPVLLSEAGADWWSTTVAGRATMEPDGARGHCVNYLTHRVGCVCDSLTQYAVLITTIL